jgi:hypothetical protein
VENNGILQQHDLTQKTAEREGRERATESTKTAEGQQK